MVTCREFEQELQEALSHIYDPDYQPSESLCALAGCDLREGALGIQSVIVRAIQDLEPALDTPLSARTKRIYDLLHNRFVLKLTQEETAERLPARGVRNVRQYTHWRDFFGSAAASTGNRRIPIRGRAGVSNRGRQHPMLKPRIGTHKQRGNWSPCRSALQAQ